MQMAGRGWAGARPVMMCTGCAPLPAGRGLHGPCSGPGGPHLLRVSQKEPSLASRRARPRSSRGNVSANDCAQGGAGRGIVGLVRGLLGRS